MSFAAMMRWLMTALVCLGLAASPALGQTTVLRVRVGAAGPGTPNGDWSQAYPTIQGALNYAFTRPTSQAVEIWVAGHPSSAALQKHYPTETAGGATARDRTLRKFRRNMMILGGFNGTEATKDQRRPDLNPTIVSGDVDQNGTLENNAFILMTLGTLDGQSAGAIDRTLVFDGLIFEGGYSNTSGRYTGAAVNISGGMAARFVNCEFRNNRVGLETLAGGGVNPSPNGQGGAVAVQNSGLPEFEGCRFIGNRSNNEGGAVWLSGATNGALFTGCAFSGNAGSFGGAVYVQSSGTVRLTSCVFTSNTASNYGGAVARVQGGALVATGCVFTGNLAGAYPIDVNPTNWLVNSGTFAEGGAMSLQSTSTAQAVDSLINCEFEQNTVLAVPGGGTPWNVTGVANRGGGAIHHLNGRLTISGGAFREQVLPALPNARGGAIRAYGSSTNNYTLGSNIRLDRVVFQDNRAQGGTGGAINTFQSRLAVYACTFFRNSAAGNGTAIYYEDPPALPSPQTGRDSILVADSLFHANGCELNQAGTGCAVTTEGSLAAQGNSRVINCTFANNTGSRTGGVMLLQVGGNQLPVPSIYNNVLFGNVNLLALPVDRPFGANLNTDASDATSFFQVRNNCIGGGYPVGLNLSASPRFQDPDGADNIPDSADDNYRLALNSPCLDAGDSLVVPADEADLDGDGNISESLPVDRVGMPRRQDVPDAPDTGIGGAPVVDMGCFEAEPIVSVSFWSNPGGGVFAQGSNWTPGAPPSNGLAVFDLNAGYSVSFGGETTIDSFEVRSDDVTFNLGGFRLNAAGFPTTVAKRADDAARLTITGGQVRLGTLRLGDAARSVAEVGLSGASSSFVCGSALVVGALGDATLSLSQGATGSALITTLGEQPGSVGMLSVVGAGSRHTSDLLTQVQRGTVDVRDGGRLNSGLLGALLLPGSRLTGDGVVSGVVFNFGEVTPSAESPIALSGTSIGTLTLENGYQQIGNLSGSLNSGVLSVELGVGGNDRLEVAGNASLAGGLFVAMAPDLVIDPDAVLGSANPYRATVLRADSIGQGSGSSATNRTFDVALFPALAAPGRYFQLEYADEGGKQVVRVVQAALSGDLGSGGETNYAAGNQPTDAVLRDLNNDGFPELILAVPGAPGTNGSVTVLRNAGGVGTGWLGFVGPASQTSVDSGGVDPVDLDVGDFDGDGLLDVIVVNRGSSNYRVLINQSSASTIALLGKTPRALSAPPGGVTAVNYYDVPGSPAPVSRMDAAVTLRRGGANGSVLLLLNAGPTGAGWQDFVQDGEVAVGVGPTVIAAGRLERSVGVPDPNGFDLVVANNGNPEGTGDTISVLFNAGTGSTAGQRFDRTSNIRVGPGPNRIIVADLEGDKETETLTGIITINTPATAGGPTALGGPVPGTMSVVRKAPGGGLVPAVTFPAGRSPSSVVAAKLDADPDLDLAVATIPDDPPLRRVVRVFRNDTPRDADAQTSPLVLSERRPDIETLQNASLLTTGDVDGDNDEDLVIVNADAVSTGMGQPDSGDRGASAAARVTVVPKSVSPCADFNGDGQVNVADLTYFLSRFGNTYAEGTLEARADFNFDGSVDTFDLVKFLGLFGRPCL